MAMHLKGGTRNKVAIFFFLGSRRVLLERKGEKITKKRMWCTFYRSKKLLNYILNSIKHRDLVIAVQQGKGP